MRIPPFREFGDSLETKSRIVGWWTLVALLLLSGIIAHEWRDILFQALLIVREIWFNTCLLVIGASVVGILLLMARLNPDYE